MRLFYVDDSGDERRMLLTAVGIPAERWTDCLTAWLDWRRSLYAEHGVPAGFELHAGHFVTGRGNPAPTAADGSQPSINTSKPLRRRIYRSALEIIAQLPVQVLTVHRGDTNKMAAYRELLARMELTLAGSNTIGIVVVDGLDEGHRAEHRELELATRHILEDPWMQPAHHSQFIQIADLIVHSAFQAVVRNPSREFMWEWYEGLLSPIIMRELDDVTGTD